MVILRRMEEITKTRSKQEEGEKDEKIMIDTLNISLSFQTVKHLFILEEDLNSRMNDLN